MPDQAQDASSPEPTVRFTVDMTRSMHRELSIAAARRGEKKVVLVRQAIAQFLSTLDENGLVK